MNDKKNFVIGALLAAIIFMAVGYAALAQLLTINGTSNINATWDVEITAITEGTMVNAESKTAPTYDATSATFEANLNYPNALAVYNVKIENKGTIAAKLDSISGLDTANTAEPKMVQYNITGVEKNQVLVPGANVTAQVMVEWITSETEEESMPEEKTKTATINFNYVQTTMD